MNKTFVCRYCEERRDASEGRYERGLGVICESCLEERTGKSDENLSERFGRGTRSPRGG